MAIFPDRSCVKPGNIRPFSSGAESGVLERNRPRFLKENLFIKTENDLVMTLCVIYSRLLCLE